MLWTPLFAPEQNSRYEALPERERGLLLGIALLSITDYRWRRRGLEPHFIEPEYQGKDPYLMEHDNLPDSGGILE